MARQVLENGVVLPSEYSDDWYDDMTSNLTKLDDVIGSDSEKLSSADVGAAALSNNYNDLDNLPTIPTVNDATLTIQKNGVNVQTFTANASSNVTCNITVPTKTSDLTNDSNFVDIFNPAVSSGITSTKVTAYDSHIADTDIHVTTADKTKWNNGVSQAYVLRYASTSVTPSSTISYSVLNNTDNIKAGDSVIDSAGQVFLIASVDSANQTVTVSAVLLTLALDANVMHLSGDETSSGKKSFSDMSSFLGSYLGSEPSTSFRTCLELLSRYDTKNKSGFYISKFRSNAAQGALSGTDVAFCTLDLLENEVRTNAILRFNLSTWNGNIPGTFSLYPKSGMTSNLGISANKWTKINGLNPGVLSFPDLSNGLDISGYITAGNGHNEYTPPVDGWISVIIKKTTTSGVLAIFLYQGDVGNSYFGNTSLPNESEFCGMASIPVKAGAVVNIDLKGSNTYVYSAKFYPCQGNV